MTSVLRSQSILNEVESRAFLKQYSIPLNRSEFASTKEEVLKIASNMNFPLVLKVVSPLIVHKSDFGGVQVNLHSLADVETAYERIYHNANEKGVLSNEIKGVIVQEMIKGKEEMLVGIKRDELFGPVLVVGLGGIFVEVMKDAAIGICPLSKDEIHKMIQKLKGYPLLNGYRGRKKLDIDSLVSLCVHVSEMALQDERILEIDLNPVILKEAGQGAIAVDARVVLQEK